MQLASSTAALQPLAGMVPSVETTLPRTRARARSEKLPRKLQRLAVRIRRDGMTVGQLLDALGERGLLLLCIILATPFLIPFSLPGTSTPGGLLMAAVGFAMVTGRATWLPDGVMRHRLHGKTWARILMVNARILRRAVGDSTGEMETGRAHGVVMMLSAAIFVLPLPIPLANMFPAYAVVCLALGLLQRNVMLQGAAWVLSVASAAYLCMSWHVGVAGMQALANMLG